jgi:hypothetical protein
MRKTFSTKRRFSPSRFVAPVVPLTSSEIRELMKDAGGIISIEKINDLVKDAIENGLDTISFIWHNNLPNKPGEYRSRCYNYYVDDTVVGILKRSGYDVYTNFIDSRYVSISFRNMLG